MAKNQIAITGFLGMNRSLQPHQLNPSEDGDARLFEIVNIDPSELREITPRPAWRVIDTVEQGVWPRAMNLTTGTYD
jgi:hypothetical protein